MSSLQEVISRFITPYKTILLMLVAFILFAVFGYYMYTQYGSTTVEKKNEEIYRKQKKVLNLLDKIKRIKLFDDEKFSQIITPFIRQKVYCL